MLLKLYNLTLLKKNVFYSNCSTFSSERHLLDDSILEHNAVSTRKRSSLGSIEGNYSYFY